MSAHTQPTVNGIRGHAILTPEEHAIRKRHAEQSIRALTAEDIARMFDVPVDMLRRSEREQPYEPIEMHNTLRSAWHNTPEQ